MADYSPISISEQDVRNFVTPPLDYADVSEEEILLKIESVETYVKYVFFDGGDIPQAGRIGVLLLIISNILSSPELARKYKTLSSERLGDYSYSLAQPLSRGTNIQSDPFVITKTWHQMGIEILKQVSAPLKYKVMKVNE